jgi:branched-chain amino acid transport system permease protein
MKRLVALIESRLRGSGNVGDLRLDLSIGLPLLALAVLIPVFGPSKYLVGQITLFFIWAATVTQWNLIWGVAGIYSLAHMAVFVLGGYVLAMFGFYFHWSLWGGAWLGALFAAAISVVIGAATLRLRGPYVMLLTLAIATVIQALVQSDVDCFFYEGKICYPFSGGPRGLMKFGDLGFKEWLGFQHQGLGSYYVGLILLVINTLVAFVIIGSPFGTAFRALRDNPALAGSRGINRVKFQIVVFGVAGFFTGLTGAFYAAHYRTIATSLLDLELLLFLFSMLVVGGLGSRWGPILGCLIIMIANELMKETGEWRLVAFGGITLIFIIMLRNGLVGLVAEHWRRWRPARGRAAAQKRARSARQRNRIVRP